MKSLRLRLILPTALATAAILAVLAVSLYLSMRSALRKDFDDALKLKAATLVELTEQHDQKYVFEGEFPRMPEYAPGRVAPDYFQIVLSDGSTLVRSPSLAGGDLPLDRETATRPCNLPSGHPGRILALTFSPRFEHDAEDGEEHQRRERGDPMPTRAYVPGPVTLLVACPTAKLDSTLAALRLRLILLGSAAVLASALLMTLLIGAGLRPVSTLAARISTVGAEDLSTRIRLENAPAELAPVVQRLNELLDRLQGAFEREHAFSADVAHELRTPLAGLQTALEVTASQPRQPREYQQTIGHCLTATRRMTAMVENLLTLARAEADPSSPRAHALDVSSLLIDTWLPFADRAADRRLNVEWNLHDDLAVQSDAEKLHLILRNLFDNAVSHSNPGGTITVTAHAQAQNLSLSVRNTGSPLTAADIPHLFERFWRHDRSRNNADGHHGLGLPLCSRIAKALGGTLVAQALPDQEFQITLTLPLAKSAEASPALSRKDAVALAPAS